MIKEFFLLRLTIELLNQIGSILVNSQYSLDIKVSSDYSLLVNTILISIRLLCIQSLIILQLDFLISKQRSKVDQSILSFIRQYLQYISNQYILDLTKLQSKSIIQKAFDLGRLNSGIGRIYIFYSSNYQDYIYT